jgi:hypothetical protein
MRLIRGMGWMIAVLFIISCESRAPLSQAQVTGLADSLQRREGLAWGQPVEVLPPASPDAQGHRWWQVRYADVGGGNVRVVVVDEDSGWARLPPPGYLVRVAAAGRPGGANPVLVAEGAFILAVTPAEKAEGPHRVELEREVVRLNALAVNTGLMPLFSLREQRDQTLGIVYGWQADRGIARDERVVEWISARTPYKHCVWTDLAQP